MNFAIEEANTSYVLDWYNWKTRVRGSSARLERSNFGRLQLASSMATWVMAATSDEPLETPCPATPSSD